MVTPKQAILIAVSGGMDSMVMLHLFSKLHKRMKLHLSVIHVNHQLRGDESIEDEKFVREISAAYGIPIYCERVDVMSYAHEQGLSKQVAARQLRYEYFEKILKQLNADAVATAHHANDNAETVLMNILRGAGIHGLAGIPPKREQGNIIRPLLFATRAEIDAYATQEGIEYRNDSSNRSLMYRRNFLRHRIIPKLKERVPNIIKTLNKVADAMQDVNSQIRQVVDKKIRSIVKKRTQNLLMLNVKKLNLEPDFLRNEIFVELLNRLSIEPTEKKINALYRLCHLPTGRRLELGSALSVFHDRDYIVFKKVTDIQLNIQQVEYGGSYDYNGYRISISKPGSLPPVYAGTRDVEYIDAERLGKQLILRPWCTGDWFIPLGMKSKKKLSDFFTDQKVPRYQKSSIPVLESDGNIVWICGKRLDDRFKLTESTQKAIRLSYQTST
jgi:tRNA(Ile)-lysidine synthase